MVYHKATYTISRNGQLGIVIKPSVPGAHYRQYSSGRLDCQERHPSEAVLVSIEYQQRSFWLPHFCDRYVVFRLLLRLSSDQC